MLKLKSLIACGVGEAARGYCLGSRSRRWRGALRIKGGKDVVVVVVVVTTVVWVVGAYESWPRAAKGSSSWVCTVFETSWWAGMVGAVEVFEGLADGEADGGTAAVEANEEKADVSWDVAVPLSVEAASMTAGGEWEAEREGDTDYGRRGERANLGPATR